MSDGEKGAQVTPSDAEDELKDVRTITGFRWFLFITSTLTAIFVYALDNTIVANIVPVGAKQYLPHREAPAKRIQAIVNRFEAVADLPWLSVGWALIF